MAKKRQLLWAVGAGVLVLVPVALVMNAALGQAIFQKAQPVQKVQPFPPQFPPDQPPTPTPKETSSSAQYGEVVLITEPRYKEFLDVAADCVKDKAWGDAANATQNILNSDKDYFVKVVDTHPITHEQTDRWASVKYEANKLIGLMPEEGLKEYEKRFGRFAEIKLDEAKKSGDVQRLAQVAQQFFHTKAGHQANDMLATYFLADGQFFQAALQFDRLLTLSSKQAKLQPLTLFKAAIAFRRVGDVKRSEELIKQLLPQIQNDGGLKLGKQVVTLDKLETIVKNVPQPQRINPKDWSLVRGNVSNTAETYGSQPLLGEILWKRSTVRDRFELTGDLDPDGGVKVLVKDAVDKTRAMHVPVMPGFFPLAIEGKLIYRSYPGMVAVNLQDVKEDGKVTEKAGDISWMGAGFDGGLSRSLSQTHKDKFNEFMNGYYRNQAEFINFIYENTLVGTISADRTQVYAIDDCAIPIPPHLINQVFNPSPQMGIPPMPKEIRDWLLQNSLQAYNIHTGKLVWRLGQKDPRKHGNFEESHFIGPPLPVGGKLYALNEKATDGSLRLITIEPTTGTVIAEQELGRVKDEARFARDPNRRVHAVHLAYGEGFLICPTNCGEVLCIDLLSRSLAWAYPYREGKRPEPPQGQPIGFPPQQQPLPLTSSTWKVAPPAVADGKVVFTAPDAKSLHCVNLRDGTLAWRKKKESWDVFLAGVWDGKAVVVGKNKCYARDLNTGNIVWEVITSDLPSGQGVCSKNVYYLPLANGEICAIDVHKGTITRNRPSGQIVTPGNLVFHEGTVISQTLEEVIAYPQLTAKLEVVEAELKKAPDNVNNMMLVGELKLANGDIKDAVDMLYKVKKSNPPADLQPRLQQKLYEALTDLFQNEFKLARTKYTDDYKELLKVPGNNVEQQKREANFYRLLGEGLENEQDLVGAFVAYSEFGSLPLFQQEGIPAKDDPLRKIPAQVWFRGHMSAMFAKAGPEQKQLLEEEIGKRWNAVSASKDVNKVRSFVSMFDTNFAVGKQARLQLANSIIDANQRDNFLEAELNLDQVRAHSPSDLTGAENKQLAAQALDSLARLEDKRGSKRAAAGYYRRLAAQFPTTVVRDGKTGKGILDELAESKIWLPYLEAPATTWGNGKFRFREPDPGTAIGAASLTGLIYHPVGETTPETAQLRLVLEPFQSVNPGPKIRLVDAATYVDKWSTNVDGNETLSMIAFKLFNQQFGGNPNLHSRAHFRNAYMKGNLAVIQVGTMAYALDLSKPAILWKQSLISSSMPPNYNAQMSTASVDSHGHMELAIKSINPQFGMWRTTTMRVGYVAAVEASYVALVQEGKLLVIDPLSNNTAKVLWSRADVTEDTEVFGDDRYIYLVEVVNGVATNGRALHAADGTRAEIPNFAAVYQRRLHLNGRQIVAAGVEGNQMVLRQYDLPTGKDVWRAEFHPDTVILKTLDPNLAGVIEPDGKLTAFDLAAREVVLRANVLQGRVTKADLRNLGQPAGVGFGKNQVSSLLLVDRDHYYVALNQPIDQNAVSGGYIASNFATGARCELVNGWFGAFHRRDGSKKVDNQERKWKAGDLHWFSSEPVTNQYVVTENFDSLPLILFSSHYNQKQQGPGLPPTQWVSRTLSLDKGNGKWVYYPFTPRFVNGSSPTYQVLTIDAKAGTVNMVGFSYALQHYIDDGRPQPVGMGDGGNQPAPVKAPVAPALPAESILQITRLAKELNALEKKTGQPQVYTLAVAGVGSVILRSGNPGLIVFPGQQPMQLDAWLAQARKN